METLTTTLVVDGSSDRTLLPVIEFLLDTWCPIPNRILFAEGLHDGPLATRIPRALQLYPCDLLFVHRDSETASAATRQQDIETAVQALTAPPAFICLVPVRMTESWLLLDQQAIRAAAGNPNGTSDLQLPVAKLIEKLPDPKRILFEALAAASDLGGRRKRQFKPDAARHRVAELMDVANLRTLASFAHAEKQVKKYFASHDQ